MNDAEIEVSAAFYNGQEIGPVVVTFRCGHHVVETGRRCGRKVGIAVHRTAAGLVIAGKLIEQRRRLSAADRQAMTSEQKAWLEEIRSRRREHGDDRIVSILHWLESETYSWTADWSGVCPRRHEFYLTSQHAEYAIRSRRSDHFLIDVEERFLRGWGLERAVD